MEKPFTVKPFRMAKYLVTNLQFESFNHAKDGYQRDEWWADLQQPEAPSPPHWTEATSPRENVSWEEAFAFCRWLSQRLGSRIRLPTEWEWQQAATGGDLTREYPWPGDWNTNRCNSEESRLKRTIAVGMYPSGATPHGVLDIAGNVREWGLNTYNNPEKAESNRLFQKFPTSMRVVRGGSWKDRPELIRSSTRYWYNRVFRHNLIGFRLAHDIP